MQYLSKTELETIGGQDYLHIYLKMENAFSFKLNNEDVEQNELFIKAPSMSNKDISDIRKCVLVIDKFEELEANKTAQELAKMKSEEREKLFEAIKEIQNSVKEESTDEQVRESVSAHIKNILKVGKTYETQDSDFFKEFDKVVYFLSQRLYRQLNDELFPCNFDIFNHLLGKKQFLIEEIFCEYVSFFFKHFPSESLILLSQSEKK